MCPLVCPITIVHPPFLMAPFVYRRGQCWPVQFSSMLEVWGGYRQAYLTQTFVVHHRLLRGRGPFGARASHALTSCFSSFLHPPFRVDGAWSDSPFEPESIEDLRMTIPRFVRFRGLSYWPRLRYGNTPCLRGESS